MSRAKRAIHRHRRGVWLIGAVGAVVVATAGLAIAQLRSDNTPSERTTPSATQPAHAASHSVPSVSAAPPQKGAVASSSVAACVTEVRTTEAMLAEARTAADHWHEHVQAQTDLLSGKNSEAATKAIWKRTRLAGPGDIAALNSAVAAHARSVGGCADLPGDAADACQQRLIILDVAATADRAAARDWANHLAAMAAHAAGDFGSEHAQGLWRAAWSGAAANLNRAARANGALSRAPACHPG